MTSINIGLENINTISQDKPKSILDLPDKILVDIFTYLDTASFLEASSVCLRWNRVIDENLEFLSSWFAEEQEEKVEEQVELSGDFSFEEQVLLVEQMNNYSPDQVSFYELLGVSHDAEEADIKSQYKKLALLLHPDKNKAPGAETAFKILRRAFDAIMSGVDPNNSNTKQFECPDSTCGGTIYVANERFKVINQGADIGYCRACKQKFGRVFCAHCFSAWTIILKPEQAGSLVTCSVCQKIFALLFPQPIPRVTPSQPYLKNNIAKKRKKDWWEK